MVPSINLYNPSDIFVIFYYMKVLLSCNPGSSRMLPASRIFTDRVGLPEPQWHSRTFHDLKGPSTRSYTAHMLDLAGSDPCGSGFYMGLGLE
ncbi:hypothetical protein DPMN_114491 [Dreissena polymorpha]|uniref:Uncharacterized protein n=1 Tax=Dreissena polymorpha TaxID=45954 RepID=A0A9D4KKN8_DREPO|nr:hypothetical protein DPMN_114491 [Dreissena polymorpha]